MRQSYFVLPLARTASGRFAVALNTNGPHCFLLSLKSRRPRDGNTQHFGPADTVLIRKNKTRSSRPAAA